jgi:hypothetical protein
MHCEQRSLNTCRLISLVRAHHAPDCREESPGVSGGLGSWGAVQGAERPSGGRDGKSTRTEPLDA